MLPTKPVTSRRAAVFIPMHDQTDSSLRMMRSEQWKKAEESQIRPRTLETTRFLLSVPFRDCENLAIVAFPTPPFPFSTCTLESAG